ncbi:hypothetical protein PYCCODRAFT_1438825 [Trametes coccinea BRFM310]|uniref:Uncharacterized protein n=1 Tax=Trametes coccinea (strain BRFM310) TaxID=1353009 RepID=A0A1Y2ICW4_TRAC3|nr:hypothetical protein PYCCODRAFT_1438825 [Trametes coccinea BRFM310]
MCSYMRPAHVRCKVLTSELGKPLFRPSRRPACVLVPLQAIWSVACCTMTRRDTSDGVLVSFRRLIRAWSPADATDRAWHPGSAAGVTRVF